MAGDECLLMKLKRKDIDRFNDEFSDFSLSSPARKIRRLDAELPPIMEEWGEPETPLTKPVIEELEPEQEPVDNEKAIVLFKPVETPYSNKSFFVDPGLVSGFKNETLRSTCARDGNQSPNDCLALVPWDPSYSSTIRTLEENEVKEDPLPIEEDMDVGGGETMDIEECCRNSNSPRQPSVHSFIHTSLNDCLNQWTQPHCMVQQPPQLVTTPISWFR